MAPTMRGSDTASPHFNAFQKRDHENTLYIAMGAAVGVFALIAIVGVYISCFRGRKHKQIQKLANKRESMSAAKGNYAKLDDEEYSVEQHPRSSRSPNVIASSSRPRSRSASRGSDSKPMLRQSEEIYDVPMHELDKRRYEDYRGRSTRSPNFNQDNGHDRNSLFLPPPAAVVQTEYSRQYDRSRSPSPAPLVLSRSITMLRPSSQVQTKSELS